MYNYKNFIAKDYNFIGEVGPSRGEELDFEARTLEGNNVRLSDLRGQAVVIETGSVTCGIYADKVNWWHKVAEGHPETRFILLYVREAQPGAKTDAHQTWEQKRKAASRLSGEWGEWREIWIDDIEGTVHRKLGELPVMMYVLDASGKVVLRANWSDPHAADKALRALKNEKEPGKISISAPLPNPLISLKGLFKGGIRAVIDFSKAIPSLIPKRIHYRRYLRKRQKNYE